MTTSWHKGLTKQNPWRQKGEKKLMCYLKNMSFKNVMSKFHCLLPVQLSFLARKHECQESMPIPNCITETQDSGYFNSASILSAPNPTFLLSVNIKKVLLKTILALHHSCILVVLSMEYSVLVIFDLNQVKSG